MARLNEYGVSTSTSISIRRFDVWNRGLVIKRIIVSAIILFSCYTQASTYGVWGISNVSVNSEITIGASGRAIVRLDSPAQTATYLTVVANCTAGSSIPNSYNSGYRWLPRFLVLHSEGGDTYKIEMKYDNTVEVTDSAVLSRNSATVGTASSHACNANGSQGNLSATLVGGLGQLTVALPAGVYTADPFLITRVTINSDDAGELDTLARQYASGGVQSTVAVNGNNMLTIPLLCVPTVEQINVDFGEVTRVDGVAAVNTQVGLISCNGDGLNDAIKLGLKASMTTSGPSTTQLDVPLSNGAVAKLDLNTSIQDNSLNFVLTSSLFTGEGHGEGSGSAIMTIEMK